MQFYRHEVNGYTLIVMIACLPNSFCFGLCLHGSLIELAVCEIFRLSKLIMAMILMNTGELEYSVYHQIHQAHLSLTSRQINGGKGSVH